MPKYYCEYCRSYLTHDSMSVRKSHLMGKNHIKYYCDYYEEQAKLLNMWEQSELPYEVTTNDIYKGIPRSETLKALEEDENEDGLVTDKTVAQQVLEENIIIRNKFIPPPPPLANLPNPPPSIYHYDLKEQKNKIIEYMKEYQDKNTV